LKEDQSREFMGGRRQWEKGKESRRGGGREDTGRGTDVQTIYSSFIPIYQIQSTRFKIHDPRSTGC